MIPAAVITAWSQDHPWSSSAQVEQDLVLSRALVEIYSVAKLRQQLIFRGGTALHKLKLPPPVRYSEDLDFVQIASGPIGEILDAIRARLNPWLGEPRSHVSPRGSTLIYRFETELPPIVRMRLKIEINTREHFHVRPLEEVDFTVNSRWFNGQANIPVYNVSELLGTKLRALYQRRKGRDLFDLWYGQLRGIVIAPEVMACFSRYMEREGNAISRRELQENLQSKLQSPAFLSSDGVSPSIEVFNLFTGHGVLMGSARVLKGAF